LRDQVSGALLAWYDDAARAMPWRVSPQDRKAGLRPDPYRIWLSEVMLQQTTFSSPLESVDVCNCLLPSRQLLRISSPLILSVLPLEELCSLVLFLQLLVFLFGERVLPPLNW
jgi:hypothetical protein